MGRKLSKNEKLLVIILIVAAIGAAYYYLFWNGIAKRIEEAKKEIDENQFMFEDYSYKLNSLNSLKAQLEAIKNEPANTDRFYSADENQEVYMDFLQDLFVNNDLHLLSASFIRERVGLPVLGILAAQEDAPYFGVTTVNLNFYVDFKTPEKLFNALDTIQMNEKIVLINSLTMNIGWQTVPVNTAGAGNVTGRPPAAESIKTYNCSARIKFVNLVYPQGAILETDETPVTTDETAALADNETPDEPGAFSPVDVAEPNVVEVPVAAENL